MLFDEIEKAHPDVWNALLQILEDGRLTDGQGHVVDFRNTVIIMTSNIGTEFSRARRRAGLRPARRGGDRGARRRRTIERGAEAHLPPRVPEPHRRDDHLPRLTPRAHRAIVDLQMPEIAERLARAGRALELTDAARDWLADKGYDPQFGARPLRRA